MNNLSKVFWKNLDIHRRSYRYSIKTLSSMITGNQLEFDLLRKKNELPSSRHIDEINAMLGCKSHELFIDNY